MTFLERFKRKQPKQCPWTKHVWVDRNGSDGHVRRSCKTCGKFYGYVKTDR